MPGQVFASDSHYLSPAHSTASLKASQTKKNFQFIMIFEKSAEKSYRLAGTVVSPRAHFPISLQPSSAMGIGEIKLLFSFHLSTTFLHSLVYMDKDD
jgi:hypothetical protein